MSTSQQPMALQLADGLEQFAYRTAKEAAAELRRQHARIAELEAQLSAIGACGGHVGGIVVGRFATAQDDVAVPDEREAKAKKKGNKQ